MPSFQSRQNLPPMGGVTSQKREAGKSYKARTCSRPFLRYTRYLASVPLMLAISIVFPVLPVRQTFG